MKRTWPAQSSFGVLLLLAGSIACTAPRQQPATTPATNSADSASGAHQVARTAETPGPHDSLDADSSAALDKVVRDVCDKSVVLLGENPSHGGERTLEIKSSLVTRLIERCGFNAVYFESGVYEFVDLNHRLADHSSAPEQVADAIGGLWSASRSLDPLTQYLYAKAAAGKIRLGGIDAQLGSATSGYTKTGLAKDMVRGLSEPRRSTCAENISRHTNWRYDADHPFDDAVRESLTQCFRDAEASLPAGSQSVMLARAATAILSQFPGGAPWRETRERQLAELFRWNQSQAPEKSKAVVWTANVHAANYVEAVNESMRPFGAELRAEYRDRMASIAFGALGGAYGYRQANPIPAAEPSSLEAQAFSAENKTLGYLSKTDLARLGPIEGSLLGYGRPDRADWSSLFDGAVVLREEKPMSMDYPPAPRFVPRENP